MLDQLITSENTHLSLTDGEAMFVYQMEVIGLTAARAAEVAGVNSPYALLKKPHIVAAREQTRIALRQRTNFTREDVIAGIKEAIDQATTLSDPMAQIAGWREIGKLLGFDKTPNVHLHLNGSVDQMRRQVSSMSNEELAQLMGQPDVLDADFYRVEGEPDGNP